jgi:hypothetical protein
MEAYGCPVFSLGESYFTESMLPKGYKTVIDWFQEVAAGTNYANPEFRRYDSYSYLSGDTEIETETERKDSGVEFGEAELTPVEQSTEE